MKKNLFLFLFLLFVIIACSDMSSAGKEKVVSKEQFSNAFIQKLKSIDPFVTLKVKGELHLSAERNDLKYNIFLDNAYQEYSLSPADLNQILSRFSQSIVNTLKEGENNDLHAERLVPVIKDALYLPEIKQSLRDAGNDISGFNYYYEELNPKLHIFYAIDTELNIRYLSKEDIETMDIPFAELKSRAISNLKKILPDIELSGKDGFYMLTAGGTYEASILLFDYVWDKSRISVKGDFVVCVPSRDLLFITGSKDENNLKRLRATCEDAAQNSSYSLTPDIFVRNNKSWKYME